MIRADRSGDGRRAAPADYDAVWDGLERHFDGT